MNYELRVERKAKTKSSEQEEKDRGTRDENSYELLVMNYE